VHIATFWGDILGSTKQFEICQALLWRFVFYTPCSRETPSAQKRGNSVLVKEAALLIFFVKLFDMRKKNGRCFEIPLATKQPKTHTKQQQKDMRVNILWSFARYTPLAKQILQSSERPSIPLPPFLSAPRVYALQSGYL
jgi:hypothetical protein